MFVTNWISTTKIQKISEITNFFRHYFLSRTEVDGATETVCKLKSCQYYSYSTDDKEELKRSKDWVEEWKKYQSIYPYITIDARVMKIEINE